MMKFSMLAASLLSVVWAWSAHAQAAGARSQLPVTLGGGLNHPLPVRAVRAELFFQDAGAADLVGLNAQGETPWREFTLDTSTLTLSGQGSLLVGDSDAISGTLVSGRGGGKLTLPIAGVAGLWTSASLNAAYTRVDSASDTDIFAVLSARYQAGPQALGTPLDVYSSLTLGADGVNDTGLMLGAAFALQRQMVAGLELTTENDQISGYLGAPLQRNLRLTGVLGVADDVDLILQLQLRWLLR